MELHRQQASGQLAAYNAPANLPPSVTGLSWVTANLNAFRLKPGQSRHLLVKIQEPGARARASATSQ